MVKEDNKKDAVKEAIIKDLKTKIVKEVAVELKELGVSVGVDPNNNSRLEVPITKDYAVIDYLIRKLAEIRYAEGVPSGKEPKDW
jgi:hypothetical protein